MPFDVPPTLTVHVVMCPRCNLRTVQRFVGPCASCREEMRRTVVAPAPDPIHFQESTRMDGAHCIDFKFCDDPQCWCNRDL